MDHRLGGLFDSRSATGLGERIMAAAFVVWLRARAVRVRRAPARKTGAGAAGLTRTGPPPSPLGAGAVHHGGVGRRPGGTPRHGAGSGADHRRPVPPGTDRERRLIAIGGACGADRPSRTMEEPLAYRARVHDLGSPGDAAAVLAVGVQDYPPGRTALPSLRLRGADPSGGGRAQPREPVLVHSARGAMHLHPAADVGLLAAALRIEDGRSATAMSVGPFGAAIEDAGIGFGAATDAVAAAMRAVAADGVARTKGELSTALSPMVDPAITPFCPTCGVHHVHDGLFRRATLQAGLGIEVRGPRATRYAPLAVHGDAVEPVGTASARAVLLRRFLHAMGPATPEHLASWLAVTAPAARAWWDLVSGELREVRVQDRRMWAHAADLDALVTAEPVSGVRLLPPYDPLTALADRPLLVQDAQRRRLVWRAAGTPGVLLVDGEVAGTWRQKTAGTRLEITAAPFTPLSATRRKAALADAHVLALSSGATTADLHTETDDR